MAVSLSGTRVTPSWPSSPGCRDEWIADLRLGPCQRYGERPAGAVDAGGLIALQARKRPLGNHRAGTLQGHDDAGRPELFRSTRFLSRQR